VVRRRHGSSQPIWSRQRVAVISSLAGRVPIQGYLRGAVRIGGFGGAEGLAAYVRDMHASAVVDATHPFAVTISSNAMQAASNTGIPLVRLERPGWSEHPRAGTWTWVGDIAAARAVAESARRPFLTTGRGSLRDFLPWADRDVLVRLGRSAYRLDTAAVDHHHLARALPLPERTPDPAGLRG
jgi:precorrin-6A/cobalt-precorrin-6A reductase